MKKMVLVTALCCLLTSSVFADFNWNVESGVWSDPNNWLNTVTGTTGTKPNGTANVNIQYSATSVCTLNTDEGLSTVRLVVRNGQTWNIENGGRVGFAWSRVGRASLSTVNMSGNGAFVMNNDDLYIGFDAGGNCLWTMSDTSSITVEPATTGGDNIYLAQDNSTGKLKLIGSQVTVHANEVLIADCKNANTNPAATVEYVLDADGASRVVSDSYTRIVNGTTPGANAAAHLILSAPGVTLEPNDIVLVECLGTSNITGKGVFNTMNGGPAAEGTPIILGGNLYTLTYKYAASGTNQNDVALDFVRSARHMAKTPSPADGSTLIASPTALSWTNPDPNVPGNSITCKVYFGTEPNRLSMDSITLAPNASTVEINATNFPTYGAQPLTNKTTYYWVVDCTETGVDPADGQGLFWKFTNDFNNAPTVDAGDNQVVWLGKSGTPGQEVVSLDGTATDDGLPNPPAALTYLWELVSGPASAVITTNTAVDTTVTITEQGTYVFRLTADDTDKQTSDTVQVIVGNNSCHASYLSGTNYNSKDFNTDCTVDLVDLADFAAAWLTCTNTQEGCL